MANVTKSKKGASLWLNEITDLEPMVLAELKNLDSEQVVELRVNGKLGIWQRFRGENGKIPLALKCGNEEAKRIWADLSQDEQASLEVVRVLSVEDSRKYSKGSAGQVELLPINSKIEENVLCLGVDVAWWGGGGAPGDHNSRKETIAYATRVDGVWSELFLKRVDLNSTYDQDADEYSPNSDPHGQLLFQSIKDIVSSQQTVEDVVLALDMPILANYNGKNLPKKAYKKGEEGGKYRQCDRNWMESKSPSPDGWRSVNIMTGAPIAPRVKALVTNLESNGFRIYGKCADLGKRVVFECFHNEILWRVGVQGFAEGLTFDTLQLYKSIGKKKVPLQAPVFNALWELPVERALQIAGLPQETIKNWKKSFATWLTEEGTFDNATQIGRTGKQFDDAIDSVLALSAVVGFVQGNAHIHRGENPLDGHIIGPGPLSTKVNNHVP